MDWPTCGGTPSAGSPLAPCCCPRPWATASSWVWDPWPGLYGAIAVCLSAAVFGGTNTFATVTTTVMVAKHTDNLAARFAVGEQWNHFS